MDFNNISKKIAGACTGLALLGTVQVNAAMIVTDVTDPDIIAGLATFSTTGADMDGMLVEARFVGGPTQNLVWGTTGVETGGVFGADFSITLSGTSFNDDAWVVENSTGELLEGLWFSGQPGLTVFDIIRDDFVTPGSALGKPFESNLAEDASIVATFKDAVAIIVAPPLGDIYHTMDVDFSGMTNGGARGNFTFSQDTDNDERRVKPVSAPTIFALFGLSILGLGWSRRKV